MEFLDVPVFDDDLFKMLVRFGINLFFLALMVVLAIRPMQKDREFAFTAVMMNVTVFFICFSLKKLDLDTGMALGLFAIFGVLRYRTDSIGVKEMTYLFIVIAIGVINSLSNKTTSYSEVVVVNLLILFSAILKERIVGRQEVIETKNGVATKNGKKEEVRTEKEKIDKDKSEKLPKYTVDYDNLEWLGYQHRETLLADLRQRTGMEIVRVQVDHIDLPKKRATLIVWTNEPVLT
ncbi:MAG: DUF4956 domain-containing protein [Pirellulales bacterium]